MICPHCGHENFEGDDACSACQHALTELSKPRPRSLVEQRILKDRIEVLQPRTPIVVTPDTLVADVLRMLVDRRIGCVVIAEGDRVLGIFSERDALMRLNTRFADLVERPIAEFMTPSPQTLEASDKLTFALHRMDLGGFRHIPITKSGQIIGMISVRDILRYITEHLQVVESN
jgi:CBS domain-containing protein